VGEITTWGFSMAKGTVEALFPYSYEAGDGRTIAFSTGDRFTLLNKTNGDWWQVRKGTEKPIYVPASYMKEISIPIYENIETFESYGPYNGEAVMNQENGKSSESIDKENESNGESTTSDMINSLDHNNTNRATENNEENLEEVSAVSSESNILRTGSSSVKLLAKSLEKVSDLVCLHHAWMSRLLFSFVVRLFPFCLLFVCLLFLLGCLIEQH